MPDVYYDMLQKDFEALCVGYNRKRSNESAELRRATYINILPHVQKLPWDQFCRDFWPIETDRFAEAKKIVISQEESALVFEKITQAHKKRLDGRHSRTGYTNRGES